MVRLSMPLAGLLLVVLVASHPQAGPQERRQTLRKIIQKLRNVGAEAPECPEECDVGLRPVCGNNNVVYLNECSLSQASCRNASIAKLHDGPCVSGQSGGRGTSSSCPENCQKIYTPLCGSDGNTYNNKCILDAASCRSVKEGKPAITVFQEGPCETREECRLDCSSTYSPVCGSNGVTYGNECWLRLARCLNPNITQKSTGICNRQPTQPSFSPASSSSSSSSCDERCTKIYQPVCGTNSRTYNNKCILDAANCRSTRNGQGSIRVAKDGVCEEDEGCHKNCDILYQPVCGSDGVTYDSRCLFDIAKCFDNRITVEYEGICVVTEDPVCTQACPKHGDPVCGSDGRTYSSLCQLKKAACNNKGLLSLYKGPCLEHQ